MKLWVKTKSKNRRLDREQLLDVKVRFQQLRKARMRFAGLTLSFIFGATLVVLTIWHGGEWLLNRFVYENPAFEIRRAEQIDVKTDGAIGPGYIRHWTGIKPGQNLLALDLAKVKRDLELFPVIESVSVERVLPDSLRIRVTERESLAQIPTAQSKPGGGYQQVIYHVDESGFIFPPLDPRLRALPPETGSEVLPIISGVDARQVQAGRPVDSEQIRAALLLIKTFDSSPMFGLVELQRIDISAPEILHVYTMQGSEIFFSLEDLGRQLHRWRLVYDQSVRWGRAIGSLDLSVENNSPLRLVNATPSTTARPKNLKAPKTKKKDV